MVIQQKDWQKYIKTMRKLSEKATDEMMAYFRELQAAGISGSEGASLIVDRAYAVATKYGEGAGAAACQMYDAVAKLSKARVPAAVPAPTATFHETAKAVYGTLKMNAEITPAAVGRLVKMAGVDTTMKNAIRDRAEWAWVPSGDTCAFCLTLASQGWLPASEDQLNGGHADHIHSNCDCTFAIRFNSDTEVEGYDPDQYRQMYDQAPGDNSKDKINAMRREFYEENKEEINEQKRDAYEKRKERESSEAEEFHV